MHFTLTKKGIGDMDSERHLPNFPRSSRLSVALLFVYMHTMYSNSYWVA